MFKAMMNEQQTLDKAGTPQRFKIMKNEAQSIYRLLVRSEEKGRGMMETAVYAMCILSAVAAIWQFVGQSAPVAFESLVSPAQPVPVMSQHAAEAELNTKS
jgi:hypothetical protein